MTFFEKYFTGRTVRFGGAVLGVVLASILLRGADRIGFLVAVTLAVLNWIYPVLGRYQWFNDFADAKYWPTFVLVGVAILFAGHQGGRAAVLAIGSLLAVIDGMYFTDNPGNY